MGAGRAESLALPGRADVLTVKTAEGLAVAIATHGCRGVLVDAVDKELAKQAREMCAHDPIIVGGSFNDGNVGPPLIRTSQATVAQDKRHSVLTAWKKTGAAVADFIHYELLTLSNDPADAPQLPAATSSFFYNSAKGTPEATLLAQGAAAAQQLGLTGADRICVPVTLNHAMGFGLGCLAALHAGAALVLPAGAPAAATTLAAMQEHHCTILFADSHTLKSLAHVQPEHVPSLRGGLTKVGSGEAFGLGASPVFAGVGLLTVGTPPSA